MLTAVMLLTPYSLLIYRSAQPGRTLGNAAIYCRNVAIYCRNVAIYCRASLPLSAGDKNTYWCGVALEDKQQVYSEVILARYG